MKTSTIKTACISNMFQKNLFKNRRAAECLDPKKIFGSHPDNHWIIGLHFTNSYSVKRVYPKDQSNNCPIAFLFFIFSFSNYWPVKINEERCSTNNTPFLTLFIVHIWLKLIKNHNFINFTSYSMILTYTTEIDYINHYITLINDFHL